MVSDSCPLEAINRCDYSPLFVTFCSIFNRGTVKLLVDNVQYVIFLHFFWSYFVVNEMANVDKSEIVISLILLQTIQHEGTTLSHNVLTDFYRKNMPLVVIRWKFNLLIRGRRSASSKI